MTDFRTKIIERAKEITFEEHPNHEYRWKGVKAPMSVTGLVSSVFDIFDSKLIATRCSKSPKYNGKSAKEIATEWRDKGEEAARLGTRMHSLIEIGINTEFSEEMPELIAAKELFMDHVVKIGITEYFCEARIFLEEPFVPGTVDFVFKHSTKNEYFIYDWKRTDKIGKKNYAKGRIGPFKDVYDTPLNKYSIQLHIYRYILIKMHGLNIPCENLYIIAFKPDVAEYSQYQALDMSDKVEWMFDNFNECLIGYNKNVKREKNIKDWLNY